MAGGKFGDFPCYKCGACCKNVWRSSQTKWLDRGDGTCVHFDDERLLCKCYETRPLVCRVDAMYEKFYADKFTWDEFVEMNLRCCAALCSE